MCMSSPKAPAPISRAAPPPVTAAAPQFDTELADVTTGADVKGKAKMGKDKLKVAPKDPSLAVASGASSGGSGNGVNIAT